MPYYLCPACGLTTHSVAAYSTKGVCASCEAPLPAAWKLDFAPQADWAQVVRSGIAAPAQARRMVASLPLRQEARDRLVRVVSELVTNSVQHSGVAAGDPIDIRVTEASGRLSVSVHDGGAGFSQPTAVNSRRRDEGHGLRIVAALSENWSVVTGPDGCTVRSELGVSSGALAPARGGASLLAEERAR